MNEKMLARFSEVCVNRLQSIENIILKLEKREEDDVAILMRELHTLKGEAQILKLTDMSEILHTIEDAILWRKTQYTKPSITFYYLLYTGLNIIRTMCENGLSSVSQKDINAARKYQQTLNTWLAAPELINHRPLTETRAKDKNQDINRDINQDINQDSKPISKIVSILKQAQTMPPSEENVQEIHTRMFTIISLSPPSFSALPEALHYVLSWVIERLFLVEDEVFDILFDGFEFLEALFQEQIKDPEKAVGTFLSSLGTWAQTRITTKPKVPKDKTQQDNTGHIAHRNQLLESIPLDQTNKEEFQHQISQIHLQKIAELFQRFPPAIRDLAHEQGKQLRIVLEGTNMRIDKTIIDALFAPLLHLVRNSVDHGIETPSIRANVGKPEKALIQLKASRIDDSLIITISDDGAGIDPQKIKDSLLRKQLLSPAEIEMLTEQQLIQQLFCSGFSTQTTVNQISGRGIGLDVVRSTVEKLGGSITVESELGKGSTFNLIIPCSNHSY